MLILPIPHTPIMMETELSLGTLVSELIFIVLCTSSSNF